MNNISVPSRFACLKIEDDDVQSTVTSPLHSKIKLTNKTKKTIKNNKKSSTIQNLSKQKQKSKKKADKQWEEWKKKDNQLLNDTFKQDMHNAILQSHLEYEAQKHLNDQVNLNKKDDKSGIINKKKKTKTMSLDQFLQKPKCTPFLLENNIDNNNKKDEAYFEKLLEATEKEIYKSCVNENRKERDLNFENMATISQIQEKLMKEKAKNLELQRKLDEAKAEITAVKARNKTLCSILGQGEIRDKAEILLELERLNVVKDELTNELSNLYKLLEQERSKTTSIESKKDKKKKNIG